MGPRWRMIVFSSLFNIVSAIYTGKYQIPEVRIEVFSPKGFKASIPDSRNLTLFVFQGTINRKLNTFGVGRISGEILEATNGRWIFEDDNLELAVGDVINYYVFVSVNKVGYVKDNEIFTVAELKPRLASITPAPAPLNIPGSSPSPGTDSNSLPNTCRPTATTVRGEPSCSGKVIFEEQFDSLNQVKWLIAQKIPIDHPEYPFVSYQRRLDDFPTVSVKDGLLRIRPHLQQSLPGFSEDDMYRGTLDLFSGCTGSYESCRVQASGSNILPPVVSGRLSSQAFSFKYGTVEVRAKLPQGDWIYPEILLEPLLRKYGSIRFASGVLKIAAARGNKELYVGARTYGNEHLYGGPVIHVRCNEALLSKNQRNSGKWGDDFHIYAVRWAPERITLTVDGEEWGRVEPAASGLGSRLPAGCGDVPRHLWANGTRMAPFDQEFYITLGIAVGGITEFRDGLQTTGGKPKPWKNHASKARLRFWEDQEAWSATWTDDAELVVDYVRVTAL